MAKDIRALRAEAFKSGAIPGGQARAHAFPTQIRGAMVTRNGKQRYHVHGYATVFNRGYEMWDQFGKYVESVDPGSLDLSLSRNPDTAFLVNHRGLIMARTVSRNGGIPSLELARDDTGLHCDAYLNPERSDVRDLMSAIDDEIATEMSFAFMLDRGEWDEDFANFRIMQADINRGDVSAVNYGANPYTSIEARSADWLSDIDRVPAVVARAAFERIEARLSALTPAPDFADADDDDEAAEVADPVVEVVEAVAPVVEAAPEVEARGSHHPLKLYRVRLDAK